MRDAVEGLVPTEGSPIAGFLGDWQGPHGELATASMRTRHGGGHGRRREAAPGAAPGRHRGGVSEGARAGAVEDHHARARMSGAGQLFKAGVTDAVYPTRLRPRATTSCRCCSSEIAALQADGCAYIQLDSLHYVERVADNTIRAQHDRRGRGPGQLPGRADRDRQRDAGRDARRAGVTVGMHMCRGNNRSAWHAEGSYEPIAEKAFSQLNVDRFLLEYDTERAGGFEPLRFVPPTRWSCWA